MMVRVGVAPASVPSQSTEPTLKSDTVAKGLASVKVITTTFVLGSPSVPFTVEMGVVSVSGASAMWKLVLLLLTLAQSTSFYVSDTVYEFFSAYVTESATTFHPEPGPV